MASGSRSLLTIERSAAIVIGRHVVARMVAGRNTEIGLAVELLRLDRAQARHVERFVQRGHEIAPVPRAGELRRRGQQDGLRRLRVGLVELERDAGRLGVARDDLGPLLEQQAALRLRAVEGLRVVSRVQQQLVLEQRPSPPAGIRAPSTAQSAL